MPTPAVEEPRRLTMWLVIGVVAIPLLFAWFTLRRGYSEHVRVGAFLHLLLAILVAASHSPTV